MTRPRVLSAVTGIIFGATLAWAGEKASGDPLGLNPGPVKTEAVFQAWTRDPRNAPKHPLDALQYIVHTSAALRPDYYAFVFKQTGLTGEAARATRQLAELINERVPLMKQAPATRELQQEDEALAKKMLAAGHVWLTLVPEPDRVRVYTVAEKFSDARLAVLDLVRNGATEIADSWVDRAREDEARQQDGYLYGSCRNADPPRVRAVVDDFKMTVTFLLTFAGPPPYVHGDVAKNKVRAEKRRQRTRILQELTPITF